MATSPLDDKKIIRRMQKWASDGKTLSEQAALLTEAGIKTTEASVRRAYKRNGLEPPVVVEVPRASELDRAERLLADERSETDRLQDKLDASERNLKRAEQVIKQMRERTSVEQQITDVIGRTLAQREFHRPLERYELTQGESSRPHTLLNVISDMHYGEVVDPEQALGISYNPEIARKRLEHVRDVTFRYVEIYSSFSAVEEIIIPVLGDMLSGIIHEELEITNQGVMAEHMADVAEMLYTYAMDCASMVPNVRMTIIPGNHPRIHKKPRHKQKFNNWEFAMGKMTQALVGASKHGDKIKVRVPKDLLSIEEIYGRRVGFMHGDGVKSNSFAGIPFYGLRQQREAVQALLSVAEQKRLDTMIIGHFHQHVYWQGECEIFINGAIKGGDEYSISTRLQATPPRQILLPYHPGHGRTAAMDINLGHIN